MLQITEKLTLREAAERVLGREAVFDTALPQYWVEKMVAQGFDPRGQVVWCYPGGQSLATFQPHGQKEASFMGDPAPLTKEAHAMLCEDGEAHYVGELLEATLC